jgi:rhodanese-related sulfurtransferase
MTVEINSEEGQIIRQLIPLSTIPFNLFEVLCNKITVEDAKLGTFLFKKNDEVNDLVYLIDGSITLQSDDFKVEKIESGTESSRFALAHQIPRKIDVISNTAVRFLRLNADLLDACPSYVDIEDNSYMVIDEPDDEDENDDDWMTTLLKSPIISALPPANLQQIIMGLEEVSFNKGTLIVKQGDPGDFYYLIKKGRCFLSRKPSENAKEIKLGLLHSKDTFGEDSLLSDKPRNVNVTALTDVSLLRLSKDKFVSLIKEPSLKYISHSEIAEHISNGAKLFDVRAPDEYKTYHLPGSINAPFFSLRMQLKLKVLDKNTPAIIVCEDGKTSEAAAFLLLRNKINTVIVRGGMELVPEESKQDIPAISIDDTAEMASVKGSDFQPKEKLAPQAVDESVVDINNFQALQLENQQLRQAVQKLKTEKDELEVKYRILFKQTEKLKSVLDALKK